MNSLEGISSDLLHTKPHYTEGANDKWEGDNSVYNKLDTHEWEAAVQHEKRQKSVKEMVWE